jgi:hypothetical protein
VWTAAGEAVGCGLLGKNKHQRHLPFPYNSELSPSPPLGETHLPFSSLLQGRDTSNSSQPPRRFSSPLASETRGGFPCPLNLLSTASLSHEGQKINCFPVSHLCLLMRGIVCLCPKVTGFAISALRSGTKVGQILNDRAGSCAVHFRDARFPKFFWEPKSLLLCPAPCVSRPWLDESAGPNSCRLQS